MDQNTIKSVEQFLITKRDNSGNKTPTLRQIKFVSSILSGEAQSPTEAVKLANYGNKTIDNPNRVINSKGVKEIMEMIGLDDMELAKNNLEILKKASKIENAVFPSMPKQKDNENNEDYQERVKGVITNDEIKEIIGGNGGFVKNITEINNNRVVIYTTPDNQARLKALELIYKVKGSFAPAKSENKNLNYNFSPAMLRAEMKKRNITVMDQIKI